MAQAAAAYAAGAAKSVLAEGGFLVRKSDRKTQWSTYTFPETNSKAFENGWLEDEISYWGLAYFQGKC